jgi:hypothetical protein
LSGAGGVVSVSVGRARVEKKKTVNQITSNFGPLLKFFFIYEYISYYFSAFATAEFQPQRLT